jgi:hypothetical protein
MGGHSDLIGSSKRDHILVMRRRTPHLERPHHLLAGLLVKISSAIQLLRSNTDRLTQSSLTPPVTSAPTATDG